MAEHSVRIVNGFAVAGKVTKPFVPETWVPCLKEATEDVCVSSLHTGVQMHADCKDRFPDKKDWCAYCVLRVS